MNSLHLFMKLYEAKWFTFRADAYKIPKILLAILMLRADYEIRAYEYIYLFLSSFINTNFLTQEFSCFSICYFLFSGKWKYI